MVRGVPGYQVFTEEEKQLLMPIWSKIDVKDLGVDLLFAILQKNPALMKHFTADETGITFE